MNFNNLVQQAQQMQRRVNKAKKEFDEKVFDFASQNNVVVGKMKGNLEIVELHIDEALFNAENKQDIEDLLLVTINNKVKEVAQAKEDTINKLTNGVDVSAFL